jgi:TRAP-type uncharacterized transport system substrate-binding protein
VRTDIPNDVVYYTLKAIFNNKDILTAAAANSMLTPEAISEAIKTGANTGVPFHPGALKYFREMGWIE